MIGNSEGELDLIIDLISLKLVFEATKIENYVILKMLPTSVNIIMESLERSKVPVTQRLNGLVKLDLVSWEKGTGMVSSTEMTNMVLAAVGRMENFIKPKIPGMLPKLLA